MNKDFKLEVSIPFKRESTCERVGTPKTCQTHLWFQFPSNGKARVNVEELNVRIEAIGFNSLQTGKHV